MSSSLQRRFITGLIGVAAVIAGTVLSKYSYGIVFFVVLVFASLEYIAITRLTEIAPAKKGVLLFSNILVFLLSYGITIHLIPAVYGILGIVPVFFLFGSGIWGRNAPNYNLSALLISGHIYIGIPLMLLNYIYLHKADFWPSYVIAILVFVWSNDIAAYFIGKYLGKSPLIPKVSPQKTWEGLVGGVVFSILAAYIFYVIYTQTGTSQLLLYQWLLFGLIASIGANLGDLIISSLKRTFHKKDSGKMLPGHGGFLDRFDGFFLAVVFIYAFLSLLGIIHA